MNSSIIVGERGDEIRLAVLDLAIIIFKKISGYKKGRKFSGFIAVADSLSEEVIAVNNKGGEYDADYSNIAAQRSLEAIGEDAVVKRFKDGASLPVLDSEREIFAGIGMCGGTNVHINIILTALKDIGFKTSDTPEKCRK